MKASLHLAAIIGTVALACSCKHTVPREQPRLAGIPQHDWLYLGIPLDEEYPDTKFHLDSYLPQRKYWRVSRVRHVSRHEYDGDLASGRMLFRDSLSGTEFYATELRGDFLQEGDTRYWVTILERKAYP
ncbi:MAG: hypothetical protein C5B58_06415 [Acidobacteria bacterium]|nr:MAG: hypothetical protein C5B58_06415 [Acidobacteriota bacterium]